MRLVEIGRRLAAMRRAAGLTQAELATQAGLTRSTVSRIETGTESDIGFKKLASLLEAVGGELQVVPVAEFPARDPVTTIALGASSPGLGRLYPDELVHAILTGQPVAHKAALVQIALEELTPETRAALLAQVATLIDNPRRAEAGLLELEADLSLDPRGSPLLGDPRYPVSPLAKAE